MDKMCGLLTLAVLLTGVRMAHAQDTPAPIGPTPVVAMQDQFGRTHDVADHRGDVVVLIFADRQGAEASRALGERLHVEFHPSAKGLPPAQAGMAAVRPLANWPEQTRVPDAKMVALACVGDIPWLLQSSVRRLFRNAVPEVPVWLDMTDQLRKQFSVRPGVANVVVLDTRGRVRFSTAGDLDAAQFQKLTQLIDNLRLEALPKP